MRALLFCFYVEVGEEWGRVEDINYGSTVWAAPVPLPCFRRLYLPCVIPQRLYAAWCRQVGQEDSKTKKPRKTMKIRRGPKMQYILLFFGQHRTIPALRLKHRSGSLFPPLAALTFAASSIICAFGLAAAAPRSPYRHLELCGIAFDNYS